MAPKQSEFGSGQRLLYSTLNISKKINRLKKQSKSHTEHETQVRRAGAHSAGAQSARAEEQQGACIQAHF